MNQRLWDSIASIDAGLHRASTGRSAQAATTGSDRRPGALAYAAYFDLLEAVLDDDVALAEARLAAFRAAVAAPLRPFIGNWADLTPAEADRLERQINADSTTRVRLEAPSAPAAGAAEAAIAGALSLLDQAAPAVTAEIRALIGEIILVAGSVNEGERFDGATAFAAWGALFLNAEEHGERIEAIDGLAHESAHALLFGHTLGAPLVENAPDERYPSPLRTDLRPLDGIFHATFVTARMHYAHASVLASGLLTAHEAENSRESLGRCRTAFEDGLGTLRRHARMTPVGAVLMDGAEAYMRNVG